MILVCVANHTLDSAGRALVAAGAPDCTILPSLGHTREWGQEAGVVAIVADPEDAETVARVLMETSSQPGGENAAYCIPLLAAGVPYLIEKAAAYLREHDPVIAQQPDPVGMPESSDAAMLLVPDVPSDEVPF